MSVTNILYRRLAEYADDASTGAIGNDLDDRDEWEELPVLLQSGDVSDLIRVAQQRGLSASTLAGSILREFLHASENYACERRLKGYRPVNDRVVSDNDGSNYRSQLTADNQPCCRRDEE